MNPVLPRAAYLHVPFCRRRCGYCNFTVVANRDDLIESYLQAIELELQASLSQPCEVDTLYIGGGTPTQLSSDQLVRLLRLARQWFPTSAVAEFSLEANPEDLDQRRVDLLVQAGVNRLSLGAQSFSNKKLKILERQHDRASLERAVTRVRNAFPSWSLDLIFAAPGETLDQWKRDLEDALSHQPDHLSTYAMTYEKGARFFALKQRAALPAVDESIEARMYEWAIDRVTRGGMEHYEVSNFARPGHRCRHNDAYWCGLNYHAVGPGAARTLGNLRETNHRGTTQYLKRVLSGRSPVAEREQLSPEQAARERLIFGLRRIADGIDCEAFRHTTGFSVEQLAGEHIARFLSWGLLRQQASLLQLTRKGLLVSDAMWPELLE